MKNTLYRDILSHFPSPSGETLKQYVAMVTSILSIKKPCNEPAQKPQSDICAKVSAKFKMAASGVKPPYSILLYSLPIIYVIIMFSEAMVSMYRIPNSCLHS